MEKKENRVKRTTETKTRTRRSIFANKKKRYLFMFLFMVPFIIGMIVFGTIAYRQVRTLINLAKGDTAAETKAENIITSMDYILRDNPTDLQKEYFAQLKAAVEEGIIKTEEGDVPADDAAIAELVAKNYVADFYTWSNKRGRYDIGGFYYLYDGEYENGDHFKENLYLKARDGFYKYISTYGMQYGKENLIEVEDVQTSCQKMSSPYVINEHDSYKQDASGEWYDYRVNHSYDWYQVKCTWTYKENPNLTMSQFAKSINLAVIKRNNRFEIIEASEKNINARTGSETNSSAETTETAETTSES